MGTDLECWRQNRAESGSDCGWVDKVQWTGQVPPPPQGPMPTVWDQLSYRYDPAGRRIEKKYDGTTVVKYLYDGDHCIAEYDGNNNLLRKYIFGPRVDEPVSMIDVEHVNATYYYHYDGLGSVIALTNASGTTAVLYEYSVYGQVAASDPDHPNRFMFTGREFDKETGLYYYRARYYNPEIGRFLQTDPVGYGEGMNLYRYCGNNPTNLSDPMGNRAAPDPCDPCTPRDLLMSGPGIISLCAMTEGTFYNSWGMRVTPDSSFKWETGKDLLDVLVEATSEYGEITTLNIFSHGWVANSANGYHHRGGVWGQGPDGPPDSGFYGEIKSWDGPESRDLRDLYPLIAEGKVKFAEGGTIFMNACHAANTGYFARELALGTHCTVYAATGKVKESEVGPDWVRWETFAEGPETEPITWKKFLPDGSVIDLCSRYLMFVRGSTAPVTAMPAVSMESH